MTFFSSPVIISEALTLEFADVKWAEELISLVESERSSLSKWMDWPEKVRSIGDAKNFLRHAYIFTKGGQQFVLFLRYEGVLAGSVGLVRVDKKNQNAEIGYWLKPDLQGKGLVTTSCNWLIAYAFEKLNLYRLELKIVPENVGSIRLAKTLGFIKEGKLRGAKWIKGDRKDLLLYSLLKKEWSLKNK